MKVKQTLSEGGGWGRKVTTPGSSDMGPPVGCAWALAGLTDAFPLGKGTERETEKASLILL